MAQPSQPLLTTTTGSLPAVRVKSRNVNRQIFRALLSIASAALLIRVAGLLNQIVVSGNFGAGAAMDAYFVASALPTFMGQLIASALEASVIPVYTRLRSEGTREQVSRLFSTLLNILLVGSIVLTLLALVFRQQLILVSAPALDPFRRDLAIDLTPFIFPVFFIMVINSYLEYILNTEGQFGWPAYAGILVPLTTALLVLTIGRFNGVVVLCIGVLLGQCLQLCVILLRARRAGFKYRPILDLRHPALGMVLLAAWPVFLGALISQAGPLVDQIFASFLSAGSISALSYALKLISVPVGVIFMSVGRAALPYLSRQASTKDMRAFKETLCFYMWTVGIATAILTALMIILAHPIVQILFQRGAFTAENTAHTARTLVGFSVGLVPMALGFILARAFSALGKTRVLMYVTTFSVIANAVFDYFFAQLWQSEGIALATSAVYVCTMFILFFTLRHRIGKLHFFRFPREVRSLIWRVGLGQYYIAWVSWREDLFSSLHFSYYLHRLGRQLTRIGIIIAVFAVGIIGVFLNPLFALRAAVGSLIILALLRYRYALLIAWVLLDALIGSPLPIFNGNNFVSGLTIPLLLLLPCMPLRQTLKRMPALAFFGLFVLWVLASIGISAIGVGTFMTIWTGYLNYIAIAMLAINELTTERRLMRFIDAILFVSTFISLYGIYGYITRHDGITDAIVGFRIFSVFGSAPTLSLFLSIVIPIALYRIFTLQGLKRILTLPVLIVLLLALALTYTRTTFITLPLSIIIMAFFLPSRKMKISLFGSFVVLSVLTLLVAEEAHIHILTRFFLQDIGTLNGRTYLWQAIISHFDPTQLLGKGLNASDVLLTNLQVRDVQGVIATAPHSVFLGTLYDHGIIGVILLLLVPIVLCASFIAGIRKTSGFHRMMFATALAILVSVFLQSIDSNDIMSLEIGIYFWVMMALPFALYWTAQERVSRTEEALYGDEVTVPRMQGIKRQERERVFLSGEY